MFRSRGILIALVIECSLSGMVYAQSKSQINNEEARYVLDKMFATRKKMRNLQCDFEYTTWRDQELAKRRFNELASRMKGTLEQLKKVILQGGNETSYQTYSIVLDCNGRGKMHRKESGIVDSSGTRLPYGVIEIRAWDGHVGVSHSRGAKGGSATLDDSPPHSLTLQIHPWRSYTGSFADRLAEAIEAEKPVNVETLPDGKYQVSYFNSPGNGRVAVIDPEKGFSCTLLTIFTDGIEQGYRTAEYEEFSDGVWFPVTATLVNKSVKGIEEYRNIMKTSNVKINDPNFSEDLFHVDLPKGTRVTDKVVGIRYVVGEPMSVKPYPDGMIIDEVAKDTLEEIAKEIEQKHEEIEIFIPTVSIALKKRTLFVLDLSDRKLISAPSKPNSEKAHKYLTKIGEGDIAWDGAVLAIRGASALTTKQESNRPLTFTKGEWSRFYKLPEKVKLPYTMLIVTKEETNYLMTVRKIESGGIRVNYRQLYLEELSRYKQESKDK